MMLVYLELGIFSRIISNITTVLADANRPIATVRLVRDPKANTGRTLDFWSLLSTTYELFLTRKQYDDVPEMEDIQGSFGECSVGSVVSYTADRYIRGDALGEATRHVLRTLATSRELAFVLKDFGADDVRRFLVDSNGKVKVAVARLMSTALWRREVFPVDLRKCRVELQTGQLFSFGTDNDGFPVFYFRNMCLGPWRKNAEATVAAVRRCSWASGSALTLFVIDFASFRYRTVHLGAC
jgi:hypothetical protein